MRDPSNILEVAEFKPEYLGFIFYQKSPRYVGLDFQLPHNLDSSIQKVGVFVNHDIDDMMRLLSDHKMDMVQLHGGESVAYCARAKERGLKVMKVFSVDDTFDFRSTVQYQNCSDYFLFDTKGIFYGGNAKVFDWTRLGDYNQSTPFFLSGGLNATNIRRVGELKGMNVFALDVNSGIESAPGVKDIGLLNEFMNEFKTI